MCRTRRQKIDDQSKERIVAIALQHPEHGPRRLARLLQRDQMAIPPCAIKCILRVEGLRSRKQRVTFREKRCQEETAHHPVEALTANSSQESGDRLEDLITAFALKYPYHGPKRLARRLGTIGIDVEPVTINALLRANDLRSSDKRLKKIKKHTKISPPEELLPAEETSSTRNLSRKIEPVVVWLRPRRSAIGRMFSPLLWGRIAVQLGLVLVFIYGGYYLARIQRQDYDNFGGGASNSKLLASYRQSDKIGNFPSRHRAVVYPEHPVIAEARIENNKDSAIIPSPRSLAGILELKLIGTLVADPSAKSVAIVEDPSTGIQESFKEGDRIGYGRLKKILRDRIILDAAGAETMIALKRTLPVDGWLLGTQGTAAVTQATSEQAGDMASATNSNPRSKGRTRFHHIDRQKVDSALADIDQVLRNIEIQPSTSHGHPSGFRIAAIEADSIFAELGLHSTDVIVGVNGDTITSPEQAPLLIQRIRAGGSVTIQVKGKRRNRIIQLDIS